MTRAIILVLVAGALSGCTLLLNTEELVTFCQSDADCESLVGDFYCQERVCLPGLREGSDAGPGEDAGPADAGFDAGPTDAGFDAGPTDAGFDAGPTDAGPTDAGPTDAGADAGPTDAGPADAGADAGYDAG